MTPTPKQMTHFTKSEVDHLFAKARAIHKDRGVTILCAPQQKEYGRALLITPRAVGNAPKRNKIRRQLRSIFYQEKLYSRGVDCAFVIRKALVDRSFDQLKALCIAALDNVKKN